MPALNTVFSIENKAQFEAAALETFYFQAKNCKVYADFLAYLKINPKQVKQLDELVYLPISAFKHHTVLSSPTPPEIIFSSSGTTQTGNSKHHVTDVVVYEESFLRCFELFFGSAEQYCFLFLLPSYLERTGSSLIYMCEKLAQKSKDLESGFFLNQTENLLHILEHGPKSGRKIFLLGVTFALLDLAERTPKVKKDTLIMETGGMKGRRKELTREALHNALIEGLGVDKIYSEYGMTELLSQAYSLGGPLFQPPPWMHFSIYDPNDPLSSAPLGSTGGINIIDLANRHSCSFIATQDLGKLTAQGNLEVLGRFDFSEIRGCNLMVS
ncbi:MAG: acyl transferase [Luteibaculaceae bacterium]